MVSRDGALKLAEVEAYMRVCGWLGTRPVAEPDTADYFVALQVQGRIFRFAERNRIETKHVGIAVHKSSGKAFLQWIDALAPLPKAERP